MKIKLKKMTKGERLYYTYRSDMYNAALEILRQQSAAEDAVHEAFVRIMKNLHKIDEGDVLKTRRFLVIICRNVAINMYNKRKAEAFPFDDSFDLFEDGSLQRAEDFSYNEVKSCVERMPQIYKDAVILNRIYGYSVSEIAAVCGISEDAVKKRITRGKAMLKKMLEEESESGVNTK